MDDDYFFHTDHELFLHHLARIEREIEIHRLDMDFHLSEMSHASKKGWKVIRVQLALVAAAAICFGLHFAYDGWWWLLAIIFSVASFVPLIFHCRYMRDHRRAHEAFDALETPEALKPYLDSIMEAEQGDEKARWWRRVLSPRSWIG